MLIAPSGPVLAGLRGWMLRAHLLVGSLIVAKQRAPASSSSGNAVFLKKNETTEAALACKECFCLPTRGARSRVGDLEVGDGGN